MTTPTARDRAHAIARCLHDAPPFSLEGWHLHGALRRACRHTGAFTVQVAKRMAAEAWLATNDPEAFKRLLSGREAGLSGHALYRHTKAAPAPPLRTTATEVETRAKMLGGPFSTPRGASDPRTVDGHGRVEGMSRPPVEAPHASLHGLGAVIRDVPAPSWRPRAEAVEAARREAEHHETTHGAGCDCDGGVVAREILRLAGEERPS